MSKAKQVIAQPIEGIKGSTVNVGDRVMYVTKGRGSIGTGFAKYIGYTEGSRYGSTVKKAVLEVEATRYANFFPDGREFNWNKDYNSATYDSIKSTLTSRQIPYVRRTTLKLNRIASVK
jgi:hypothetical protein